MTTAALVHPGERILTIDVLRGFALFGILFSHMIFWYSGGALPQEYYQPQNDVFSMIAMATYLIFFIGKFFSLFSFLFGLSFFIQMQSLEKRGDNFVVRFAWRLGILGIIGTLHHIFWRADILSIYVPLGFLLLFFRHLSNRILLIIGVACVLNIPTKIAELVSIALTNHVELIAADQKADAAVNFASMTQANWSELFAANWQAMKGKWIYQVNSGRAIITFGYFLLGMLVGRLNIFETIENYSEQLKRNTKNLWKVLGGVALCYLVFGGATALFKIPVDKTPLAQWLFGFFGEFFNTALTFLYIHIVTRLMMNQTWQHRLSGLGAMGKMALTSYLTQSVIGVLLFFHVGIGLLGITSPAQNCLLAIAIFATQMLICRWWLSYFRFGPVEWLWRSATYLKWQPFVK